MEIIFTEHFTDKTQVVISMQVNLNLTPSEVSAYIAPILGSLSLSKIKIQLNKVLENV